MKESQVVKQCTDLLKAYRIIHWKNHVLNGRFSGFGQKKSYVIQTGLKGLADMSVMLNDGRILFVEYKSLKGGQSQDQKDFEKECNKRDIPYIVISDVNDLREILEIYGVIK